MLTLAQLSATKNLKKIISHRKHTQFFQYLTNWQIVSCEFFLACRLPTRSSCFNNNWQSVLIYFQLLFNTTKLQQIDLRVHTIIFHCHILPHSSFNPVSSSWIIIPYCTILYYGTVLCVQTLRVVSVLFICKNKILTHMASYPVKNDKFDIQFASTIADVDKDIYVVDLFYWPHCNTPKSYTPIHPCLLILQLRNKSSYNIHLLQCIFVITKAVIICVLIVNSHKIRPIFVLIWLYIRRYTSHLSIVFLPNSLPTYCTMITYRTMPW